MKTTIPPATAQTRANNVLDDPRRFCSRIEIAGYIRRTKPQIGDIQIVAIPRRAPRDPASQEDRHHIRTGNAEYSHLPITPPENRAAP